MNKWKIEESNNNWDMSLPHGNFSDDKISFYHAIKNVKKIADYLNSDSKIKKNWFATSNIHKDNCTVIVEHNDFAVRLFFEFNDRGFCDIIRHYTNGSSYNDEDIASWHYAKYDMDYNFDMIKEVLEMYFERYEE